MLKIEHERSSQNYAYRASPFRLECALALPVRAAWNDYGYPTLQADTLMDIADANYDTWTRTFAVYQSIITPTQTMAQNALAYGFYKWPTASSYLQHYINNRGGLVTIDVRKMVTQDNPTNTAFRVLVDDAVRYADSNWTRMHIIGNAYSTPETAEANHADWHKAIGQFEFWADVVPLSSLKGSTRQLSLSFYVEDVYDFDINSTSGVGRLGPWGSYLLKDSDLAALHRYGVAQAFRLSGTYTVTLTWVAGNRAQITVNPPIPPRP